MNAGAAIVEVKVHDRAAMDRCLGAALARMIEIALPGGSHGVLVTRLSDGHFTVELSEAVTFGYTKQLDAWNRPN